MMSKSRPEPGPAYMSDEQMAQYLHDLRTNRSTRPGGSRPPPPSRFTGIKRAETEIVRPETALDDRPSLAKSNSMPTMPTPDLSHRRADSSSSIRSPFAGRALARPPSILSVERRTASPEPEKLHRPHSIQYVESGARWMEKQEVKSIRTALEDMDFDEENKIHAAAQDEAAKLVWQHQNPGIDAHAPLRNPDVAKDYKSHLRKSSYQRSLSQEHVSRVEGRKASDGGQRTSTGGSADTTQPIANGSRKVSPPTNGLAMQKTRTPSGKSYGALAAAVKDDVVRAHRRTSSGTKRIMSGEKKSFMHKNDRIWEDPQEEATPPKKLVLREDVSLPLPAAVSTAPLLRKNPFSRIRMQQDRLVHSHSAPVLPVTARHNPVEIQKNVPSQSKKAWYVSNEPLPPTPPPVPDGEDAEGAQASTPTKDGKEIRGDDIRSATSRQRKDRSPNLPRPTVVSDKPGRPIVSFQSDWRPKEIVLEEIQATASEPAHANKGSGKTAFNPAPYVMPRRPDILSTSPEMPPAPTICVPDDTAIPSIILPGEPDFAEPDRQPALAPRPSSADIPVSTVGALPPQPRPSPRRPLPTPTPHHAATSPLPKSTPHYTPTIARHSGALCAHCALPIAGRILSAGGQRFHPCCFVCHACNTNLELVAFYPEPDTKREERLARIAARQMNTLPTSLTPEELWALESEDGEEGWRFYCHLDFHELFSPRCKSCHTPIEGEVVVACGAEWHVGHFFCAQCGDPFDSRTPFVEKDGYAWCVGCHTNRYSSKCRKCRKPVTDVVVKALGADWHQACFRCLDCSGAFEDGRYFLRGESQDPVCMKCEEKRLKA